MTEGMQQLEAFEKFSTWKKRQTPLCVTVIERGKPEDVFSAYIDAIDQAAPQVGICLGIKQYATFDVGDAKFSIEPDRVVASRDDIEWLIFEEEN